MNQYIKAQGKTKFIEPEFTSEQYIQYIHDLNDSYSILNKKPVICDIVNKNIKYKLMDYTEKPGWNDCILTLQFKGGDANKPENYRPVCRLKYELVRIESVLQSHIRYTLKIDKSIQFFGNTTICIQSVYDLTKNINKGALIFLDIKNAYGCVNYDLMSNMINDPEIKQYFLKFYSKIKVTYKGLEFNWCNGLIQGSPLSNLYFLIYMDYIFKEIKPLVTNIYAFSDDLALYFDSAIDLQPRLNKITDIFAEYNLQFNHKKSYYYSENAMDIKISDNMIAPVTKKFKYLGAKIFSISHYTQKIAKKLYKVTSFKKFVKYLKDHRKVYLNIYSIDPIQGNFEKLLEYANYVLTCLGFDKNMTEYVRKYVLSNCNLSMRYLASCARQLSENNKLFKDVQITKIFTI